MAGAERRVRVLALLASHGPSIERMCGACVADLPGVRGAGLMVMSTLPGRGIHYLSDETSARVEELQFTLGEGPGVDAFTGGRPVLVADLADREHGLRWPAFAPGAVTAGARALFSFPLQIGTLRIGVLDLYRDRPGRLDDEDVANASVYADTITLLLVTEEQEPEVDWQAQAGYDERAVVHQATGVVMTQLGGTIAEAFARLRAHAYAEDRPLHDVAEDVVQHRLRLDGRRD
jgi:hypothetical protein